MRMLLNGLAMFGIVAALLAGFWSGRAGSAPLATLVVEAADSLAERPLVYAGELLGETTAEQMRATLKARMDLHIAGDGLARTVGLAALPDALRAAQVAPQAQLRILGASAARGLRLSPPALPSLQPSSGSTAEPAAEQSVVNQPIVEPTTAEPTTAESTEEPAPGETMSPEAAVADATGEQATAPSGVTPVPLPDAQNRQGFLPSGEWIALIVGVLGAAATIIAAWIQRSPGKQAGEKKRAGEK